jgi:transcriptional regulator with XRE-family HTH domain
MKYPLSPMRKIRISKGITLDEMWVISDKYVKMHQSHLSRIERGITIPSKEQKNMIAKILEEPIEKIFPDS